MSAGGIPNRITSGQDEHHSWALTEQQQYDMLLNISAIFIRADENARLYAEHAHRPPTCADTVFCSKATVVDILTDERVAEIKRMLLQRESDNYQETQELKLLLEQEKQLAEEEEEEEEGEVDSDYANAAEQQRLELLEFHETRKEKMQADLKKILANSSREILLSEIHWQPSACECTHCSNIQTAANRFATWQPISPWLNLLKTAVNDYAESYLNALQAVFQPS